MSLYFGDFALDQERRQLLRAGEPVAVEAKAYELLSLLVTRRPRVLSKTQIRDVLWPGTAVGETSLPRLVTELRQALGDDAQSPRFIRTAHGFGYAFCGEAYEDPGPPTKTSDPEPEAPEARRIASSPVVATRMRPTRIVFAVLGAAAALGGLAVAVWRASSPPPPRITASTQITNDRLLKGDPVTDGSRLYFAARRSESDSPEEQFVAQVATTGGETVTLTPGVAQILDISPNGTKLLVTMFKGIEDEADIWVRPVLSGAPRRVGDLRTGLMSNGGAWSPDGARIVYAQGSELRLARSDGTESRTLVSTAGRPFSPRWSPDGKRLRYSVRDAKTFASTLWEASTDGTNAKEVLPGWKGAPNPCCGAWTPDGRYFVFVAGVDTWPAAGDIWALREERAPLQRGRAEPVQLTFGPIRFGPPVPSRDGKRLFVVGGQEKGELTRLDARTGQFAPYLSGISARSLAFSKDGGWAAYATVPERTLWRSRVDGTERLQLTFPPLSAARSTTTERYRS